MRIDPKDVETRVLHGHLLSAVAPRPIALVSTVDNEGNVNLSPYSFFNVFSANPPMAIFSPARRVRNNTTKDTLTNAEETAEVVINIVSYDMVQQTSLSSTEYETGVNEFVKAGFTELPSEIVRAPRVAESPVQLECKVREVVHLGDHGGAGNLVIAEIVMMHINEAVLGEDGNIDQHKIDTVGRLGKNWYVRASGDALFEVEKPLATLGIGVDQIPKRIRESYILSGNDLGKLGNVEKLPSDAEIEEFSRHHNIESIMSSTTDGLERREMLHHYAKELLEEGKVEKAWKALLVDKLNRV